MIATTVGLAFDEALEIKGSCDDCPFQDDCRLRDAAHDFMPCEAVIGVDLDPGDDAVADDGLIGVREAGRILGLQSSRVHDLVKLGELEVVEEGRGSRGHRFDPEEVEALAAERAMARKEQL